MSVPVRRQDNHPGLRHVREAYVGYLQETGEEVMGEKKIIEAIEKITDLLRMDLNTTME